MSEKERESKTLADYQKANTLKKQVTRDTRSTDYIKDKWGTEIEAYLIAVGGDTAIGVISYFREQKKFVLNAYSMSSEVLDLMPNVEFDEKIGKYVVKKK